jgi:hypothetical protein
MARRGGELQVMGGEAFEIPEPQKPKPTLNQTRWKLRILRALQAKNAAGLGDFLRPKKKDSKRNRTREFWRTHPEVKPWNLKNGKLSPHWRKSEEGSS